MTELTDFEQDIYDTILCYGEICNLFSNLKIKENHIINEQTYDFLLEIKKIHDKHHVFYSTVASRAGPKHPRYCQGSVHVVFTFSDVAKFYTWQFESTNPSNGTIYTNYEICFNSDPKDFSNFFVSICNKAKGTKENIEEKLKTAEEKLEKIKEAGGW